MAELTAQAEAADRSPAADGMDIPAEIARREERLVALAEAKAKIEQRAAERHQVEQEEYKAKMTRREAQRKAGKKPRGKDPEPPAAGPRDKEQINLTPWEHRTPCWPIPVTSAPLM